MVFSPFEQTEKQVEGKEQMFLSPNQRTPMIFHKAPEYCDSAEGAGQGAEDITH